MKMSFAEAIESLINLLQKEEVRIDVMILLREKMVCITFVLFSTIVITVGCCLKR